MKVRVLAAFLVGAWGAVASANPAPAPAPPAKPAHPLRVVTDTSIEILDSIRFVGTTPQIATPSLRTLDAIASTLAGNPSLLLIEVHAFGADSPHDQWLLGELRARAVVAQLVARGVDRRRLRAVGEAKPARGAGPGPEFVIALRAS